MLIDTVIDEMQGLQMNTIGAQKVCISKKICAFWLFLCKKSPMKEMFLKLLLNDALQTPYCSLRPL